MSKHPPAKSSLPPAGTAPPGEPAADPAAAAEPVAKSQDLGHTERRKMVRPLPTPDAVESHGDTDWAVFQSLLSDKPQP